MDLPILSCTLVAVPRYGLLFRLVACWAVERARLCRALARSLGLYMPAHPYTSPGDHLEGVLPEKVRSLARSCPKRRRRRGLPNMRLPLLVSRPAAAAVSRAAVVVLSTTSDDGTPTRTDELGATALLVGTAIGGGFLALPYTTAPSGGIPSAAVLTGCWA